MFIRPKGIARVALYDTPGFSEKDVSRILGPRDKRRPGSIDDFLSGMESIQEFKSENLLNDNCSAFFFKYMMSGGGIPSPYNNGSTANSLFSLVILTTTNSEPSYTDSSNEWGDAYNLSGNIGGGSSNSSRGVKFFDIDSIEDGLVYEDSNGREAISYRSRWLFLPNQGVSSSIAGFSVYFSEDGDNNNSKYRGRSGRVLFRDGNGTPIIVNKLSTRTMFLEYTITWASV